MFDCDLDKDYFIYDIDLIKNISYGRNIVIDNELNNSTIIDIKFN